uniref:Uncharacterized protein n=1 Tax=Buteo japonicus TaxID=224669 RepID=A0A8C0BNY0_9AVES
ALQGPGQGPGQAWGWAWGSAPLWCAGGHPSPPGMEVRAHKLLQAAESVTMIPSLVLHAEFMSCSCPCPESWISSPARRLPLPAGLAAFALPACLPPRPASSSQGSPVSLDDICAKPPFA